MWFRALWFLAGQKRGVSAMELKRVLGLKRYETAWALLRRLRMALAETEPLSGILQVDEARVGVDPAAEFEVAHLGKPVVVVAVQDKAGRP